MSLAAGDYANAYECYNILHKVRRLTPARARLTTWQESNWSKAVYTYAKGVALYELGDDEQGAADNLRTVPSLMQRIIGKSVPLEVCLHPPSRRELTGLQKFAARRARKYLEQGQRLICPGIELAYVLNCLDMAPRFVLFETHLDQISDTLTELHAVKNVKKWGDGRVYWDGTCSIVAGAGLTRCRLLPRSSAARNRAPLHCPPAESHQAAPAQVADHAARGERAGAHLVQVRIH